MILFMGSSTILILLVLLLRTLFRGKVRAGVIYALWGLVLLRLLFPVQIFPLPDALHKLMVSEQNVAGGEIDGSSPEPGELRGNLNSYLPADSGETRTAGKENSQDGNLVGNDNSAVESEYIADSEEVFGAADSEIVQKEKRISRMDIIKKIWVSVACLMFVVILLSNVHRYRQIKKSRILLQGGKRPFVYQTNLVSVPCLYGLVFPSVYLPENVANSSEEELSYILSHEKMHYRHLDFIWSAVRVLLVCVYWFHPMVWVAARVSRRDAEFAADEAVIKNLKEEERISYGKTILGTLRGKRGKSGILSLASTVGFSKKELEKRIIYITQNGKKSAMAVLLLLGVVMLATACSFAGKTEKNSSTESAAEPTETASGSSIEGDNLTEEAGEKMALQKAIGEALKEHAGAELSASSQYEDIVKYRNVSEAHAILAKEENQDQVTVYLAQMTYYYRIGFEKQEKQAKQYGGRLCDSGFCALTFEKKDGAYELKEYWTPPKNQKQVVSLVDGKFPDSLLPEELDMSRYTMKLQAECHQKAIEFLKQSETAGTREDIAGFQRIENEVEKVDIYTSKAAVTGLDVEDNPELIKELVEGYNRMKFVPVTNLEENSMHTDAAVTISFYSKGEVGPVQIIFDSNRLCWVNGIPATLVMDESYFDLQKIQNFAENQMWRGKGIPDPCKTWNLEMVEYENDYELLKSLLSEKKTVSAAFVEQRARKRSALNGGSFYEEYNKELEDFIMIKKLYLLAKDLGIRGTEKEAEEYVQAFQNDSMVSKEQVEEFCESQGISTKKYWDYMKKWHQLTQFDYASYLKMRNITEEELQTGLAEDLEKYRITIA